MKRIHHINIGDTFGSWTVKAKDDRPKKRRGLWLCVCSCGKEKHVQGADLCKGKTTRCRGCYDRSQVGKEAWDTEAKKLKMIGKRFGQLIVNDICKDRNDRGNVRWKCTCDCGNTTVGTTSSLNRGDKKSCGCLPSGDIDTFLAASKKWIESHKGEKHPHFGKRGAETNRWKDTDYSDRKRESPEYKQWRLNVYKRDNFTCQCCGAKDKSHPIHAHHIRLFHSIYNEEDAVVYDVDNGIVLCKQCHHKYHIAYGKTTGSKSDIVQFISSQWDHLSNQEWVVENSIARD